jgi:hypothetical protein
MSSDNIPAWAKSAAWVVGAIIAAFGLLMVIISNYSSAKNMDNKYASKESIIYLEKRIDTMEKNLSTRMNQQHQEMLRRFDDLKSNK